MHIYLNTYLPADKLLDGVYLPVQSVRIFSTAGARDAMAGLTDMSIFTFNQVLRVELRLSSQMWKPSPPASVNVNLSGSRVFAGDQVEMRS